MIWILFIASLALSLWAAARVKSVCHRYNQQPVRSGWTGAGVAAEILLRKGIWDVEIAQGEGVLGDHYDPHFPCLLALALAAAAGRKAARRRTASPFL